MLRIWLCTDRKLNTSRMMDEICTLAGQNIGGQLLIVPEQFSHTTERMLCRLGGDSISRFAEVLGFSRLATRVFSEVGGCAETETDAAGRLLAMSLAVEQVRSRLKLYASCADKPEFLLQMLDTFDEFHAFCVTSERLRAASGELTGALAVKTEELALLMDSLDAVCANMGQNPQTRLTRLLHAVEGSTFAAGKRIYFDGFTDFNGVEREIIAQLLQGGAEVSVYLQCDAIERGGQQFERARHTVKALRRIAQAQSARLQIRELTQPQEEDPLAYLRKFLFLGKSEPYLLRQEKLAFLTGSDKEAECRAAVGEMLRLVESGYRWRDISVACADFAGYRPVLESILRRAAVPAYYAGDTGILCQPVVRMLLSALEAATGGMEQEPVLAYLKSGFLPLTRDGCDRLENYVLTWNISGSLWEKEWTMNPYGVDRPIDERGKALLRQLNVDRASVIAPLSALKTALQSAKNTAQSVSAFNDFLEKIELNETLHAFAEQCSAAGNLQRAQEYAQIYRLICGLMEQMYGVMGQSVRSAEGFYRMFRAALSKCSVGTIPARLDCVTVGSLMSQRRCDTKIVFLLGANEGAFPAAQENRSLLTDSERGSLRKLGIELSASTAGRLEQELAAIDSVLNAPEQRLYLGAITGREAYFYTRAASLFENAPVLSGDAALTVRSEREYLSYLSARTAQSETLKEALPELMQQARALASRAEYHHAPLRETTVRALYGQTLRLSSTKITNLASCRFRYFLEYGLRAKERRTAQVDQRIYGLFVHDVLERTVRQVMQEGGFTAVSLQRVQEIAERFMLRYEEELSELWDSPRAQFLFRRNFAEVRMVVEELYRELSASDFMPAWMELKFSSGGGSLPAVRIVGKNVQAELEGTVDRADVWRAGDHIFVRVIDYKTGKKGFDYTDVFYGLSLQMLLYLFALIRSGDRLLGTSLTPAGVLYFPARVEMVPLPDHLNDKELEKKRKEKQKRSGLLLNSAPVLEAMEHYAEQPRYLPYQSTKEGRTGDLATETQFDALERFVYRTVAALSDELYSGEIAPNPYFIDDAYRNACVYCPYASVCGEEKQERRLKTLSAQNFWEKLEEADG